eukprot:TRINITY_DN45857_c0_g1_i1.p1 TRINITY_DN45857_c0_g1~~TRINITY_DN45857_c0_g1_i1.p1  ORF type:complete len:125 (+),score=6.16 TRINITY_DN45857_c0_g1_i1:447-821(+)
MGWSIRNLLSKLYGLGKQDFPSRGPDSLIISYLQTSVFSGEPANFLRNIFRLSFSFEKFHCLYVVLVWLGCLVFIPVHISTCSRYKDLATENNTKTCVCLLLFSRATCYGHLYALGVICNKASI